MDVKPQEDWKLSRSLLEKFETEFVKPAKRTGLHENNNTVDDAEEQGKWVDVEMLHEGQQFIRQNFFAIFFAHFISLIFLLCYTPVQVILLRTGRSNTAPKALKRYVGTLVHIKAWYESNLTAKEEEDYAGSNDISRIRILHTRLSRNLKNTSQSTLTDDLETYGEENENAASFLKAIRADFSNANAGTAELLQIATDEDEQTPAISQLDMCVTQFCFMGFLYLFPKSFGIDDATGLDRYVHVWAVIGRKLGIQDRFNICLQKNFYTHRLILRHILLPEVAQCGPDTPMLWNSLTSGIAKFIPFIALKAILRFVLRNLLNSTEELHMDALLSFYDILCYKLMNRCFTRWIFMPLIRWMLNGLLRLAIWSTLYFRFPNILNRNSNVSSSHQSFNILKLDKFH